MSNDKPVTERPEARTSVPTVTKLEQGIATWALILRTAKQPEERRKAMKTIRELSRRLAMAKGEGQ